VLGWFVIVQFLCVAPARAEKTPAQKAQADQRELVTETTNDQQPTTGRQPESRTDGKPKVASTETKATSIRLLQQGPALTQDGNFFVDVEVSIPSGTSNQVEVAATVHQRVRTRREFAKTNLGLELGSVIGIAPSTDISSIAVANSDQEQQIPVRITINTGSISSSCPGCVNLRFDGVYPVSVELRSTTSESVIDRFTTYVIRRTTQQNDRLNVALIVPLATPTSYNALSVEQIPSTRNIIGIIEALVARKDTRLTIAPSPESIDTLARLAEQDSGSNPLLGQVRDALGTRELLSAPYMTVTHRFPDASLAKRVLEANRSYGESTIQTKLLGVGPKKPTTGYGIYGNTLVGSQTLTALRQQRLVLRESALQPSSEPFTANGPVLIDAAAIDNTDGVPLLGVVLDDGLEGHFVRKLSNRKAGADDVLRAQHLLADLSMLSMNGDVGQSGLSGPQDPTTDSSSGRIANTARSGQRGIAVTVPSTTSQATLSEVLSGIENNTIINPITLTELFDLPLASSRSGSALVRTPRLNAGQFAPSSTEAKNERTITKIVGLLDGYRTSFQTPPPDADDLEKRLISALALSQPTHANAPKNPANAANNGKNNDTSNTDTLNDDTLNDDTRQPGELTNDSKKSNDELTQQALSTIEAETYARIGTIHLTPTDGVTLTGRQQNVPIPIINDSGRPATVVLEVASDNVSIEGSIADPDRPGQLLVRRTIVIPARVHQEEFQVTTRGPGSFSMVLRLTTPSGLALSNVRYTLRSTAVSGLGKILTIGALMVLAVWWIRSTLRTRRLRSRGRHPAEISLTDNNAKVELYR
jgi:hypothetical protein